MNNFSQEELSYFCEISFGSDLKEHQYTKIKRWKKKELKLFLTGTYSKQDSLEVKKVVDEINEIINAPKLILSTKNNGDIPIIFDSQANFRNYSKYADLTLGFTYFKSRNSVIRSGYILIPIDTDNEKLKKHAIREEITQILGMAKDSKRYPESIFYQNFSVTTKFAPIDIKMLQLHNNYGIRAGMRKSEFIELFIH